MTDTMAGEAETIVRRWANWIIDESADRDDVSDHDAGKRKVRAERDTILKALAAQPSAEAQVVGWIKRTSERHPIGLMQPSDWRFSPHKPALGEGSKAEWFDVHPVCIATHAQPDTGAVEALREALERELAASRACGAKAFGANGIDLLGFAPNDDDRIRADRILAALSKPNAPGREG